MAESDQNELDGLRELNSQVIGAIYDKYYPDATVMYATVSAMRAQRKTLRVTFSCAYWKPASTGAARKPTSKPGYLEPLHTL
jgi:hypothetical protein